MAKDIISGYIKVSDDGTIEKVEADAENIEEEETNKVLSENDKKMMYDLLNNAISDYGIYLDKVGTIDDRTYVENKIKELQKLLAENTHRAE